VPVVGVKGKGPVFKLDRAGKARMIEAVLAHHLGRQPEGLVILDVGCGNGDISQHLGRRNTQYGVDVDDKRRSENRGFRFRRVDSERLPFETGLFDVVISHHVIEHTPDQRLHLSEIRRVLKSNGTLYLATPNKSSPVMQGHKNNPLVLRYEGMRPLFKEAGFRSTELSVEIVRRPDTFEFETRALRFLPRGLLRRLRRFFPSHVFVLTPDPAADTQPSV
jgi:SAM-dependent methyltransferase